MRRRRTIRVQLARDPAQDDATLAPGRVDIDLRVTYPPGTRRQTLLQAIGDTVVKACAEVLDDPATTGPIEGVGSSYP